MYAGKSHWNPPLFKQFWNVQHCLNVMEMGLLQWYLLYNKLFQAPTQMARSGKKSDSWSSTHFTQDTLHQLSVQYAPSLFNPPCTMTLLSLEYRWQDLDAILPLLLFCSLYSKNLTKPSTQLSSIGTSAKWSKILFLKKSNQQPNSRSQNLS